MLNTYLMPYADKCSTEGVAKLFQADSAQMTCEQNYPPKLALQLFENTSCDSKKSLTIHWGQAECMYLPGDDEGSIRCFGFDGIEDFEQDESSDDVPTFTSD